MSEKIYFDNAATTWPKYPFVKDAVEEFLSKGVDSVNRTNSTNFSIDKLL